LIGNENWIREGAGMRVLTCLIVAVSIVCCVASDGFAQRKRQRKGNAANAVKPVGQAEIIGTIKTVFAIGAESTGLQIEANGLTFELDLADNAKLNAQVEELSQKDQVAQVCGELVFLKGIERRKGRWVLRVKSVKSAKKKSKDICRVELFGKIESSDNISIGGETTGRTLDLGGAEPWELDVSDSCEAERTADELVGKSVRVVGTMSAGKGVERRDRRIVKVDKLTKSSRRKVKLSRNFCD
jgi:hypothetical protein